MDVSGRALRDRCLPLRPGFDIVVKSQPEAHIDGVNSFRRLNRGDIPMRSVTVVFECATEGSNGPVHRVCETFQI